ncbi:MAG: F0F1 ATP synthase subunit gamma [Promicromonosporaceae bacterium]|nr:F0F1 ATP synthase subunit gamma [Promicromonosporaceae bacterium]
MSGGAQRIYRQKIASTAKLQKVFRAQELIAASRIGAARARVAQATPYAKAITQAVAALAAHARVEHPLVEVRTDTNRVGVLTVSADRGMAGSYSAANIRETDRLLDQLKAAGKEVDLYVAGRRAYSHYVYRGATLKQNWVYGSDHPTLEAADQIAATLLTAFTAPAEAGGVAELHVVYTQFVSMVTQTPRVVRLLPLEVVDSPGQAGKPTPLYEFEPGEQAVLDALLPRYVHNRLYSFLLESAASELAARQAAMRTATDNATDLIKDYTRLANQARQADITQEITEIVSGADALSAAK